jgi:glycosyltransferase involved in cell wall biosynthesis
VDADWLDVRGTPSGLLRLIREGARRIRSEHFEALHLLDARLAPAAVWIRRRHWIALTATIDPTTAPKRRLSPLGWLRRFDEVFCPGDETASMLNESAPGLAVCRTGRTAPVLLDPSPRALASMAKLLRDATPGRLVVAVPWPRERERVRWLRDAVVPLLDGRPQVLLLGAPGGRDARLLTGASGMQATYRTHVGRLDAVAIAAAARCADVFFVPGEALRLADREGLLLALAASGVPVVAGPAVSGSFIEHERNGFAPVGEDSKAFVSTLNQLLAMPATQRHYLGEEFRAYTLQRWSWERIAPTYAERFAALVGRPQIPVALRAA